MANMVKVSTLLLVALVSLASGFRVISSKHSSPKSEGHGMSAEQLAEQQNVGVPLIDTYAPEASSLAQNGMSSAEQTTDQQPADDMPHIGIDTYEPEEGGVPTAMSSGVAWIVGKSAQSCTEACQTAVLGSCSESELRSLSSSSSRSDAFRAAGVQCSSNNTWDYGQGVSQCVAGNCCAGGCVGACSSPRTQACSTKPDRDYGRLCPCALPRKRSTDDFTCAKANDKLQKQQAPRWHYPSRNRMRPPSKSRQPFSVAWEPVLEPVHNCIVGARKEFKFLVGLDASWVTYYNQHRSFFDSQGYRSAAASAQMMFDHVSYIWERQFNIKLSIGRVYSLPGLRSACTEDRRFADGSGDTSIREMLQRQGVTKRSNEAGIIRLGVGLPNGTYCHSYAGMGCLCGECPLVLQAKPFHSDGYLNTRTFVTLAHEIAHQFAICPRSDQTCVNGHTENEVPDIMVWDGRPVKSVRQEGMFFKFMPTCSHTYTTILCKKAREARCV